MKQQRRNKPTYKPIHNIFDSPDCHCGRCRRARWIIQQSAWSWLSPEERVTLFWLVNLTEEWTGQGPVPMSLLADSVTNPDDYEMGMVVSTTVVRANIRQLCRAGLVKIERHSGYPNVYHIAPAFDEQDEIEKKIQQNLKLNRAIVQLHVEKHRRNKMLKEWLEGNEHISPKQRRWLRDGENETYDKDYYLRG